MRYHCSSNIDSMRTRENGQTETKGGDTHKSRERCCGSVLPLAFGRYGLRRVYRGWTASETLRQELDMQLICGMCQMDASSSPSPLRGPARASPELPAAEGWGASSRLLDAEVEEANAIDRLMPCRHKGEAFSARVSSSTLSGDCGAETSKVRRSRTSQRGEVKFGEKGGREGRVDIDRRDPSRHFPSFFTLGPWSAGGVAFYPFVQDDPEVASLVACNETLHARGVAQHTRRAGSFFV